MMISAKRTISLFYRLEKCDLCQPFACVEALFAAKAAGLACFLGLLK